MHWALIILFLFSIEIVEAQNKPKLPRGIPENFEEIAERHIAKRYPNYDSDTQENTLVFDVSLDSPEGPIVFHSRQSSNVTFSNNRQSFDNIIEEAGGTKELQERETKKIFNTLDKKLDNIITLKKLPKCLKSSSYGIEVANNTKGSEYFDYLFYDPKDKAQRERVAKLPFSTIPYIPGNSISAIDSNKDPRPLMAVITGVRCLPTRVHFTKNKDNIRYFTYEEGAAAYVAPAAK